MSLSCGGIPLLLLGDCQQHSEDRRQIRFSTSRRKNSTRSGNDDPVNRAAGAAYCRLAGVMDRAEARIDRSIHFQPRRCVARKTLNFRASFQYSPQALGDRNRRRLFCRVRIRRCASENSLQAISILFDRFSKAASFKMTPACCRQAFLAIVSRAVI